MSQKKPASSRRMIWMLLATLFLAAAAILAGKGCRPFGTDPEGESVISPYSQPGVFPVGFERIEIGLAPTRLSIWYPADCASHCQVPVSYSYEVKFDRPLGTTSLASYQGSAFANPARDQSQGPYPLVILSPGFGIGATSYAWLAEHLASYGFVVISLDHAEKLDPRDQLWRSAITRLQEIEAVLAFVDRETSPGGMFEGLVDREWVAVIGHSYGGYTALAAGGARIDTDSFLGVCRDAAATDRPGAWLCQQLTPRIEEMAALAGLEDVPGGLWPDWGIDRVDALVPIAADALFFGQAGLSRIEVPLLAIGGTADQDAPYDWGTGPSYQHSSGDRKAELAFLEAGHMIFTGPCESIRWYLRPLSGEFCSDPDWDRSYAHQITQHFTTAFLLAELKGDQDAARYLSPDSESFPGTSFTSQGY